MGTKHRSGPAEEILRCRDTKFLRQSDGVVTAHRVATAEVNKVSSSNAAANSLRAPMLIPDHRIGSMKPRWTTT
jgi:hypothetical protein